MARGEAIRLKGADGFEFGAYRVQPSDARHGGLVLIQEIFGVTPHIQALADSFAEEGYEVIAPSLYDRLEPGFQADYQPDAMAKAVKFSEATSWDQVEGDLNTSVAALKGPVFVTGFCWGGTASWLAACRCEGVAAASCFYGRRIPELIAESPKCPTILHFGRTDKSIPMETVEAIAAAHPDIPIHLYDAGHGFVSDRSRDYSPDAARLARLRTLQLFQRSSGVRAEA